MSTATTATALPPSVLALNALLGERQAPDRRLRVALGVSYVSHALTLAAAVLLLGTRPYRDFGETPTSTGILEVTPLYSAGAPPGPRPAAVPAAPRPAEEAKPEKAAPEPVKRPEVAPPPDDDADILREAKRPVARNTPKPKPNPPSAAPARTAQAATATPGGGTLPSTRGAPGSPTGTLSGDPDGGLTALLFSNQWYAARIRDIVYSNWGDPFYGQARPETDLHVLVRFVIERDGRVSASELEGTSGSAAWDRSGLRAVENSKLPPLPPDYPGARLVVHYEFRTTQ